MKFHALLVLIASLSLCEGYYWTQTAACSGLRSLLTCEQNKYCYWYPLNGNRGECVSKVTCDTFQGDQACTSIPYCKWDNGQCEDRCMNNCLPRYGCRNQGGFCTNRKLLNSWDQRYCVGGSLNQQRTRCVCETNYNGQQCERCPKRYGGGPSGNCSVCISVTKSNGACQQCTMTAMGCNLSGTLRTRVGNVRNPGCACQCRPNFEGPQCDRCIAGRYGVNCELCDASKCNGRSITTAVDTSVSPSVCTCNCDANYGGNRCQTCAAGRFNYPTCTLCDTSYCSGRATSTAVLPNGSCQCSCPIKYTGNKCQSCSSGYFGANCDECSVASHCNNNAVSATVGSGQSSCSCSCKSNFVGAQCDSCAAGHFGPNCLPCNSAYCNNNELSVAASGAACSCTCKSEFAGPTCGSCADGFFGYPLCTRCDAGYCSNKVSVPPVTNTQKTTCLCQCETGITGPQCESCETNRISYPTCTLCSSATHCNSHARYATAVLSPGNDSCSCTCKEGFGNPTCDVCLPGYLNYPLCTPSCTVPIYCHGNAVSATQNGQTCTCDCKPNFEGNRCDTCSSGFVYYPECRSCNSAQDCSNRAQSVSALPTRDGCSCSCSNYWDPSTNCSTCLDSFGGSQCDECAAGYFGSPPTCELCNITTHCNGRATNVVPNDNGCSCSCINQWGGTACEICPPEYGGSDCDSCALNYVGTPPECAPCDNATHCNSRASSVTSDGSNEECICVCSHQWEGSSCETCPSLYDQDSCSSCANMNATDYPACTLPQTPTPFIDSKPCDISLCHEGHATGVTINCSCICKDQYAGPKCEVDCGNECNYGKRVALDGDVCQCECDEGWEGTTCSTCNNETTCDIPTPEPTSLNPISVFSGKGKVKKLFVASAPIGTTAGARLSAIATLCGAEDDLLDPEIAPLKLKVGSSKHAGYIGGILGNIIIMVSPIVVHFVAVLVRMRYMSPKERSFKTASADMRFPYLSLFFVIFMYHGMATCGLKLSVFGTVGEQIIGISSLLCFNVGFLVLIGVQNKRLTGDASYHKKETTTVISRYFLGPGEWVSASVSRRVHRWGLLFEMYRPGFTWFLILECIVLFIITIVQIIEADEMPVCRNLAALLASMFGCLASIIFFFRPWASFFDNHGNLMIIGLEAIACGFLARGFHTGDTGDWGFTHANRLLTVVSYLTVIKGLIDPLLLLYVEWDRRSAVQRDYYHTQDEPHELTTFDNAYDDDYIEDSLCFYNHSHYSHSDMSDGLAGTTSSPNITKSGPFSLKAPSLSTNLTTSYSPISKPMRLQSYPLIEKWRNSQGTQSLTGDNDAAEVML